MPITSRLAIVRLINLSNTVMMTSVSDGSDAWSALSPNEKSFPKHPLNASQKLIYRFSSTVTSIDDGRIDVYGYILERRLESNPMPSQNLGDVAWTLRVRITIYQPTSLL